MSPRPQPTRIIDSHTGGEPTRVVNSGGPELGNGSMAERLQRFKTEHDPWRRALMNEPRGSEVIVGALITPPTNAGSHCGVIYFNNVGYLGMCGHGTIGLVTTLAHLGQVKPGEIAIDTPVGTVKATLHDDRSVTVANVPAYRTAKQVAVDVPGLGRVHGDIAWGGNWFFLCADHGLSLASSNVKALTAASLAIKDALVAASITGADGAEVDHIELTSLAHNPAHHGRNFVLCPGGAYDRSPCGTGTSAKLACLAADGKLAPGALWHQESVIDTVFTGHYHPASEGADGRRRVLPFIRGRAHITLEAALVFDEADPLTWGFT